MFTFSNDNKKTTHMNTNFIETIATVTEMRINDTGIYAMATCGKVTACVCINDWGVRVICINAAHKVWRGAGRGFATVAEAIEAYKKPEMKAIIAAVDAKNT